MFETGEQEIFTFDLPVSCTLVKAFFIIYSPPNLEHCVLDALFSPESPRGMWRCSGLPSGHCEGRVSGMCLNGCITNGRHLYTMFFIFLGPAPNPETVHRNMAVCGGDIFERRGR